MTLPLTPPIEPMLAKLEPDIPDGNGWLYEPKWDGFRSIVFKDGNQVMTQSRDKRPMDRYFPELLALYQAALPERCVVDGEIVLTTPIGLDFEQLQQRIHPAESRVNMLSKKTPVSFVAFDLLAIGDEALDRTPFEERRRRLEQAVWSGAEAGRLTDKFPLFEMGTRFWVTPQTSNRGEAAGWFDEFETAGLDGVVAKSVSLLYEPGKRAMVKVKHKRTADCVVGGYRVHKSGQGIGSLLLGLYDESGTFHHVGAAGAFSNKDRLALVDVLKPYETETSGTFGEGRTPGIPSRWATERTMAWNALRPELVCEVTYDYMEGDRFRHLAQFLRWRTDKQPRECTFDQLARPRLKG
jgi:ATP-dependent DNA ligase